jgi:D-beta-D-heptose 7-phosphate kinase/D-beta-D-heptose 1-phosphate adenosyltransferase
MSKKIFNLYTLKARVTEEQNNHKKIVFTNGCFDIVHAGHIRYLYEAKSYGDRLVVGVNSDKSVSLIKPGRPVIPQEQRMEVLAALEMVDYVILFEEDTPLELIKTIKPDVLVKGADWALENIVGREIAKEVYRIHYVEGISTTQIIQKILMTKTKEDHS